MYTLGVSMEYLPNGDVWDGIARLAVIVCAWLVFFGLVGLATR